MGTGKCSRLYQTDVSMRDLEDSREQWKVILVRGSGIVWQIQRRRHWSVAAAASDLGPWQWER